MDESKIIGLEACNEQIVLKSGDEKTFVIEKKDAFLAKLVSNAFENDTSAVECDIPSVKGSILELVVQYLNHHHGVEAIIPEKPLRSKLMIEVCKDKFDAMFIDDISKSRQNLYDLILAANYMDIKCLLHLGCAKGQF